MRDDSAIFVMGLFVGAALGGMAALLLAPASGRKIRRDIGREGRKIAHRATERLEDVRDKGADAYEKAREAMS